MIAWSPLSSLSLIEHRNALRASDARGPRQRGTFNHLGGGRTPALAPLLLPAGQSESRCPVGIVRVILLMPTAEGGTFRDQKTCSIAGPLVSFIYPNDVR